MSWTSTTENQIKLIHKRCLGYKWIYSQMIKQYQNTELKLIIPIIIVGPVIGVLASVSTITPQIGIQIVIATLALTSSIMGGIYKYVDCQGNVCVLKSYLGRYSSLSSNIERQ